MKLYREVLKQGRRVVIIQADNSNNDSFAIVTYVNNGDTCCFSKSFKSVKGAQKAARKFLSEG